MQFKILIEETISDTFCINANNKQEAILMTQEKYRQGEFILAPGNLLDVKIPPYPRIIKNEKDTFFRYPTLGYTHFIPLQIIFIEF